MTTYLCPGNWGGVGLEVTEGWIRLAMTGPICVHVCAHVVRPRELRQRMPTSSQGSAEKAELLRAKSLAIDLDKVQLLNYSWF
jgi:hypothetical protein